MSDPREFSAVDFKPHAHTARKRRPIKPAPGLTIEGAWLRSRHWRLKAPLRPALIVEFSSPKGASEAITFFRRHVAGFEFSFSTLSPGPGK